MLLIFASPTLNYSSINRPDLTLVFDRKKTSCEDIKRIANDSFVRLVKDGLIIADGCKIYSIREDLSEFLYSIDPLNLNTNIDHSINIPFACNRYLSFDATYIENLVNEVTENINTNSPMTIAFNGYDHESMPELFKYTEKQKTVVAWKELLIETSAVVLGEIGAYQQLINQIPEVTRENFETVSVLPFTVDNVHKYIMDIFLCDFSWHLLKDAASKIIGIHTLQSNQEYVLEYPAIDLSEPFNNESLQQAYSDLKILVQLALTNHLERENLNQKIFILHGEFFASAIGLTDSSPVTIFDNQVKLSLSDSGTLKIEILGDLVDKLIKEFD